MTANRNATHAFIYATLALAVAIISQMIFPKTNLFLGISLFALVTGIFVLALHHQPGPKVTLTSSPLFLRDPGGRLEKILKPFRIVNYGMLNQQGAIQRIFKSFFAWLHQNRLLTGSLALIFGVLGQVMLLANQVLIGAIISGLATFLFLAIFHHQSGTEVKSWADPAVQQPNDPKWLQWGRIVLGLSIVLAVLAFWLFGTTIPTIFPWMLHLSSVGLLILSSLWMNKFKGSDGKLETKDQTKKPWNWLEIGIFIVILAVAAFMRLYRFDQIPFGTWFDEADYGLNALKILREPGYLPVYVESTQLPAHFIYLIALAFRVLGVSTLAIRSVSVVFGLGTVVVAYYAGRELFERRIGFVLAFLLAISRWDVIWSRIGMHGVSVPFFELLTIALILKALRRQRLIDYALAGLSVGLGICFYFAFRLFPLVIALFLLVLWFNRHDFLRSSWRGLLVLSLSVFIASVPVTQLAVNQPEAFWGRMRNVSIFAGKTASEGWQEVSRTTSEHLLMFNYQGDHNGRHNLPGEPMLDPISGALLVLGAGLSLWRIRQPGSFLLVAWLLIMLAPGIFSLDFESPQSLRAIGSLPAAYLLAVVPIQALWQEWEQTNGKRPALFFILPLVLSLVGVGYYNFHVYFNLQAKNSDSWSAFSTPETIIGKRMAELGPQVDTYVSTFYYNTPTTQFLAPEIKQSQPLETYQSLPIISDGLRPVVFFVDEERKLFYQQAQHYYPDADFKEYKTPNGDLILYQITLKPVDIAASQGITASYYRNADWTAEPFLVRKEKTIAVDWKDGQPAQFPFGVKWQGVLYAEKYGLYQLSLRSPAPAELTLDNKQVQLVGTEVQTAQVELAKGSHELVIKTQGQEGRFELDWQPPEEDLAPVPYQNLFVIPISNNGLLGKYFANGDWQDPPAFTQVDPWIHFYFHNQPLPRPYTVEWTGRINISAGGHYRFALESIDESELFIDEAKVVSAKPDEKQAGELDLSPGFHTIRLRFADRTGYTHINLYWTPPNAEEESIPQEALFLP